MVIKKLISFWSFALASILCFGQIDVPTHTLISTAGGDSTLANGDNYSWSIGEVVVFEDSETKVAGVPSRFTISQAMQSYPPFVVVKDCPTITVKSTSSNNVLCTEPDKFSLKLSYAVTFSGSGSTQPLKPDTIQWYLDNTKIAGANSEIYQPYFPGKYKVHLTYNGLTCGKTESTTPISVTNFSPSINQPIISESGSPVNLLTATTLGTPSPTIQWYVSYKGKYLMIAGGSNRTQKIRYNGDYMVVATYGTCRLSSFHSVRSHSTSIMRAEDVTYDANTIYIPDEMAYSESTLKVYPNPATGQFFVQFQSSSEITTNAQLFSNTGVLVKNIAFTEGSTWSRSARVDTDDLGSGVYFLKVDQEGKSLVQKVVLYK